MSVEVDEKEEHFTMRLKSRPFLIARLKRYWLKFLRLKKLNKWWWWILPTMFLSDWPYIGRTFTRLAGLPLGPYRSKVVLSQIKTYISPKAQINCPNFHLGRSCFIDDFVTIFGSNDGSVVLGRSVHIYQKTVIETGQGGRVVIGEETRIQPGCTFNGFVREIRIGRQVMIATGCGFVSYQHKIDDVSRPIWSQGLSSKGDIVIEDDVWLGMGVKVMDGVRIGRGAVVGANAVVTKDIPPYSIAVGVPARVVRKREQQNKPSR